jgi:hypothetical protein
MRQLLKTVSRPAWIFMAFVACFCALFIFVESNNGRLWTNDYLVYYEATRHYFAGKNPYGVVFGLDTGLFKYTPFTLFLFYPVVWFSYVAGQFFHLALLSACLMVSIPLLKKLVQQVFGVEVSKKQSWILYVSFLTVAIHLVRELHMGNINLLLLLFLVLGMRFLHAKKPGWTSLFWSLMLIFKPIMILAVIPLLLLKKWKLVFSMAAFGVFFLLFPVLHEGWHGNLMLWSDWLESLSRHMQDLGSYNALNYLFNHYFGWPVSWLGPLLVLGLLALLMWLDIRRKQSAQQVLVWIVIFIAFIPNFFQTDTEHFLLTIPLLVVLLYLLSETTRKWLWGGFVLGFILFSLHSTDLLGAELSEFFAVHGLLGIGNLVFIATLLLVWKTKHTELSAQAQ